MDTVATALPDGYTIDLRAIASLTDFLGYDSTTNTTVVYDKWGDTADLPTISPTLDVRNANAHVKLWDGHTLVLGLKNHFYDVGKEAVAEPDYFAKTKRAGDHPHGKNKEMLVFITVTLVDSTGNRVHSSDDLPFAQKAIPPQDGP